MRNTLRKNKRLGWLALTMAAAILAPLGWAALHQAPVHADPTPSPVKVVKTANGFQLLRNGQPYFVKGAGGDGSKTDLKAAGANSWRTWGVDNLDTQLAEAQTLGMTVTAGIWLGHKDNGFSYNDANAVAAQKEMARRAILRYRNSPALLTWALGNEMETGGNEDNTAMWDAIEDIAKMAHTLDPNHPTMTVVAEIGGDKVAQINAHCPDIDIVGLNSYGGGSSIGERYKAAGGVKPYEITEFGPAGTWESGKNAWGVVPELTSTEKAIRYAATYEKGILNQPLCLGSYAFTWGNKREATDTWFGLLLPDGSRLGAVDTLTQLWSGHAPASPCPVIGSLTVDGTGQAAPSTVIHASLDASDPQNAPLTVQWVLEADPATYKTGGAQEAAPPTYPDAVLAGTLKSATVKLPALPGAYRLYAYIHDGHGGAAVGNVSLDVQASPSPPSSVQKASLPLTLYGGTGTPFIPSGYMGNTGAIKIDTLSADSPRSGKTCLRASYTASDNWGGVAWQNPDNNWGDKAGGWNLSGAKTLSFWARGAQGGEVVSFSYGLIGADKPFHDTGKGGLEQVTLTKEWEQYTIDLKGQDLSRIVTGFAYSLAASGQPVTFYLDDIKYE